MSKLIDRGLGPDLEMVEESKDIIFIKDGVHKDHIISIGVCFNYFRCLFEAH